MNDKEILRLRQLTVGSIETGLSADEKAELEGLLFASEQARDMYLDLVTINTAIRLVGGESVSCNEQDIDKLYNELEKMEINAPCVCKISHEEQQMTKHLSKFNRKKTLRIIEKISLIAAMLCICLLLYQIYYNSVLEKGRPHTVATITDSMAMKWSDSSITNGSELKSQDGQYHLESGSAKIMFTNGVEMLIENDAVFTIISADKIDLIDGSVFLKVPSASIGFIVETPSSRIIDLGTEFGVNVGRTGISELHMFKGKCSFSPKINGNTASARLVQAGEAIMVNKEGKTDSISLNKSFFLRALDVERNLIWHGEDISLADIIGNGNGTGTGKIGAAIEVSSGEYSNILMPKTFDNIGYNIVRDNKYIDGVFIPDGEDASRVTSVNHIYDGFKDTLGTCWLPILNGPATSNRVNQDGSKPFYQTHCTIGGERYGTKDNPAIYMHSNAAITFDLKEIRNIIPGQEIKEFSTFYGMPLFEDADSKISEVATADFTILIDGVEVLKKENVRYGEVFNFKVEISKDSEFLTLACTDSDGTNYHDWGVFARTMLILENQK